MNIFTKSFWIKPKPVTESIDESIDESNGESLGSYKKFFINTKPLSAFEDENKKLEALDYLTSEALEILEDYVVNEKDKTVTCYLDNRPLRFYLRTTFSSEKVAKSAVTSYLNGCSYRFSRNPYEVLWDGKEIRLALENSGRLTYKIN